MDDKRSPSNLRLIGGELCLDFANTVDWHASEHPVDWLTTYEALLAWGQHAGILTESEVQQLALTASARPQEAAAALRRAIELREAIYRIFVATVRGEQSDPNDLAILKAALTEAMAHARLVQHENGFAWEWTDAESAERVRWAVARSAAELLTSDRLDRVRQCAFDRCGWLFVDNSRNRSRRWCVMEDCGNRAKARRYYRRQKAGQKAS